MYQTKADKADLEALESKLDELLKQLFDMIPNKDDLKKKFDALNKRLRALEGMLKNLSMIQQPNEDDAMLTKKKLGPMNCASCDKGLHNLSGVQPNPYAWRRMPQRIEPDRIANYGIGYSWFLKNLESQQQSALSIRDASVIQTDPVNQEKSKH